MQIKKEFWENLLISVKVIIQISFLIGSILLAFYFISIKYVPFLTFSDTLWIVLIIFILGLIIIFFLGYIFFSPGLYFREVLSNINSLIQEKKQSESSNSSFFNKIFFIFILPFLINYVCILFLFKKYFSISLLLSLIIFTFYWIAYIIIVENIVKNTEKIKKKNMKNIIKEEKIKIKKYFHIIITGFFIFISFWLGIIFFKIIKINDNIYYLWLLIYIIFFILSIYTISSIPEKTSIKVFIFIFVAFPIAILLIFGKIDIIYKIPIKLLHLGNVKITLILDKEYSKQLKKVLCKPQQNKTLCNQLSNSFLQGFLLFRTPKGYLIKINKDSKNKPLYIKENFIKSYFFDK